MEPVEFRDMEYVMAVHEEQSFSGAARKFLEELRRNIHSS